MQAVHLFAETMTLPDRDLQRLQRISRAGGLLWRVARGASRGINPVTVWLEAAISVCDAVGAWARYEQARQITRQLQTECDALRRLHADALRRLDLARQAQREQARIDIECIDQCLRQDRRARRELLADIANRRETVERMRAMVVELRASTSCQPVALLNLEAAVESLVRAQMQTLLQALDPDD